MKTTHHTPGPWSRNIKPATKYPVIFAGRNTHIAQAVVSGLNASEVEANVSLIRSAPDLLAVVGEWLDCLDNGIVCEIRPGSAAHLKAREVFKKATEI